MLEWFQVVAKVIQSGLRATCWQAAIEAVGVLARQRCLSGRLRQELGWETLPGVSSGLPSHEAARTVFPRSVKLDIAFCLSWRTKHEREGSARSEKVVGDRPKRRKLPETFQSVLGGRRVGTLD